MLLESTPQSLWTSPRVKSWILEDLYVEYLSMAEVWKEKLLSSVENLGYRVWLFWRNARVIV